MSSSSSPNTINSLQSFNPSSSSSNVTVSAYLSSAQQANLNEPLAKRARKISTSLPGVTDNLSVVNVSNPIITTNSTNSQVKAPLSQVTQLSQPTSTQSSTSTDTPPTTTTSTQPTRSPSEQTIFNWPSYIDSTGSEAAPVHLFKHLSMTQTWRQLRTNTVVEVANSDVPPRCLIDQFDSDLSDEKTKLYWFASVVELAGYFAKLRYAGYGDDDSADFWLHMGDIDAVHEVGWCALNGHPICPPYRIANKYPDWEEFVMKFANGCHTICSDFSTKVRENEETDKFKKGMLLEVIDKKKPCRMRVAKIIENKGGRLRLKYEFTDEFDDFYCHAKSPLIHPIGWSVSVGHEISATPGKLHFV